MKVEHGERKRTRAVAQAKILANCPLISNQMPGNELAISFANTLTITDVRYDITYYGAFLKEIPRRLGSSVALDASVKAVVTAYPYFRHQNFSPDAYMEYCNSLRALRESLNDPIEAQSPNTLCAVYLITICQVRHFVIRFSYSVLTHTDSFNYRAGLEDTMISLKATVKQLLTS
jgi:hypothetical protein